MVEVFKNFLVLIIGDVQLTATCSIMDIVAIACTIFVCSMLIKPIFNIFKGAEK